MKINISIALPLLASGVVARPRVMDDPLPQRSRVTAFIVDDKGNPSIECWELSIFEDSASLQRKDGSRGMAHSFSLTKGNPLEGLDILTWPTVSDIWPPSLVADRVQGTSFDLGSGHNLYSVQSGLIQVTASGSAATNNANDDVESHIFSLENGDDWFYFEDDTNYGDSLRPKSASESPFSMNTVSASNTELLRARYSGQPTHKVLHKGACRYTGISIPDDASNRVHSPLTVQVEIKEGL